MVITTRLILTLTPVLNEEIGHTEIGSSKLSIFTDEKAFMIQLNKGNAVLKTDLLIRGNSNHEESLNVFLWHLSE